MKIRSKLLLAFFSVTLISVITLSLIAINNATQTLKREIEDALNSLVDGKVNLIYNYIEEKEHGVAILSNLPMVTEALENLPTVYAKGINSPQYLDEDERIRLALKPFKERFDVYDIYLIAPNGDIVFTFNHEKDFATNLKLGPYRQTHLAKVFDRTTTLLESSVSQFIPYTSSQWQLQESEAGPRSKPLQGAEKHSAFIAAPVFKVNRMLGALAIQLNDNDYHHLATDYSGLKRTGEVVIGKLENNHAVVIAPLRRNHHAAFNLRIPIGSEFARPIQLGVLGEKGSGLSIDYNGTEILAAWRYIPELQWGVVVKIDAAEAFAAAELLKERFLLIGIEVMLLTALIALFFANKLSTPLVVLTRATEEIMKGDYDQKIAVQTTDEIGQLGHSFNRMTAQLKQSMKERTDSEQALRESQVLFRSAFDNANIGMALVALDSTFIETNQAFCNMLGYTKEKLSGTSFKDITYPDDVQKSVDHLNRLFNGEIENFRLEKRYLHKQGHKIWGLTIVSLVCDKNAAPLYSIAQVQDITEQKRAKASLKASEERIRVLLDSTAEAIYGLDLQGNCTFCNAACLKILGYEKQADLLGKNMHNLIHHTRADGSPYPVEDCQIYKAFLINEKSHVDTEVLFRKDGSSFPAEYWSYPIIPEGKTVGSVVTFLDITERKQAQAKLTYQASHDALTGLINRDEFERRVKRLLATIRHDQGEHALCYMDLDQFKVVNDTCGHTAGDELLRQLSLLLQHEVRKRDTLARLGGDEFAVLMEHCSLDHAHRVAASLHKAIQSYQFSWDEYSFKVGVSIGLVAITDANPNLTELLQHADAACYIAKDLGRNRIHVYHEKDECLAERHGEMQWVTRIDQALVENRFCLYAQAIVPLGNSKDMHYELLLRMKDEQGNLIPPGAFLPAAERYNLIEKLDAWIIKNVFNLIAENPSFIKQVNFISINLSGQSLTNPNFLQDIIAYLDKFEIEKSKICFEITETTAIANLSSATKFITSLKVLGCRFALDDFGSGLSSFAYLKNLPVDYLKIDGMFVKDIVDDPVDRAMVKSINEIGQVMGMKTIAEFVENNAIKEMLREIGVDYAQGYGIEKPKAFSELIGNTGI